jgi:hypothetical protein
MFESQFSYRRCRTTRRRVLHIGAHGLSARKLSAARFISAARIAVSLALLGVAGCGARVDPTGDSSTHFWQTCADAAECGNGYECICGRCTKECASESECPDVAACGVAAQYLDCEVDRKVCAHTGMGSATTGEDADASSVVDASSTTLESNNRDADVLVNLNDTSTFTGIESIQSPTQTPDDSASSRGATSTSTVTKEPPKGPQWSAAESLEDYDGSAWSAAAVADSIGNIVAIWIENDDATSTYGIAASRYTPKGGWGLREPLVEEDSFVTTLCADSSRSGNVVVAWVADDVGISAAWATTYAPSSGWSTPTPLGPELGQITETDCAVDDAGNVTVIWSQSTGSYPALYGSRFAVGDTQATYELVSGAASNLFHLNLAADNAGNAVAVWNHWEGQEGQVWANRFVAGGNWEEPTPLDSSRGATLRDLDVSLDAVGNGRAVWGEEAADGSFYEIKSSAFKLEEGWSDAEFVAAGTGVPFYTKIGLDDAGNAVVAWEEWSQVPELPPENDVRVRHYTPNEGWEASGAFDAADITEMSLSVTGDGQALISWRTPYAGDVDGVVQSRYLSPQTGWLTAGQLVNDALGDVDWPRSALSEAGIGAVVWVQANPLTSRGEVFSSVVK